MSGCRVKEYVVTIKLPQSQVLQLNRLREALAAKAGKQMTLDGLVQKIIEDFLAS